MSKDEIKAFIVLAVVFALGVLCGFFIGKGMYDRPIEESVTRDTVTIHDTVPDYYPVPKDSARIKWVARWLPKAVHDTVYPENYAQDFVEIMHDTVAVQVPITSKHYGSKDYDAWVSGYEPSLDSIKVYKETQYITETVTKVVKENKHFFLDISGGCNYIPDTKSAMPFAELGFKFKTGKFGIGAYGGYSHDTKENKATPYAGVRASYDIISF